MPGVPAPVSPGRADAVVFDLDGTVWDSAPGILHCLRHTLHSFGVPIPPDPVLIAQLGPPLVAALAELGVPGSELDVARDVYRAEYRRVGEAMCSPYPGIVDLLDGLRGAGIRLATATSKGVEPTRRMLDAFELTGRFDVVAAASMTASQHSKVEVIAEAIEGLRPAAGAQVVMVGDRSFDIEGGRALGLGTIGVTWGYASPGELSAARPDLIADSVAALSTLLVA